MLTGTAQHPPSKMYSRLYQALLSTHWAGSRQPRCCRETMRSTHLAESIHNDGQKEVKQHQEHKDLQAREMRRHSGGADKHETPCWR